jgi:hypothetical protein
VGRKRWAQPYNRFCLKPREDRRSLHYATPDFLLISVALSNFMRLSLLKAAHAVVSSAAWQEIRVSFGRDDHSVAAQISYLSWKLEIPSSNRIVISTGAQRSGEICGVSWFSHTL